MLTVLLFHGVYAQDSAFARKMVDTLASRYFWGRGYTRDGMHKAADFLVSELKSFGVAPMDGKSYLQPFSYSINTFPGKMEVAINGVQLVPGKDFLVSNESRGVKCDGKLFQKDSVTFIDPADRVMVTFEKKLTWSAEQKASDYTWIQLDKTLQKDLPVTIKADIENKLIDNYKTANVCGIVKGTSKPDSIIVYTAHYDHLGSMGADTYFPGANDNASGDSEVLMLAKYYGAHPQPYSIAFIFFAGEEAGLLGSQYFTKNPLIPLSNIRFLVNLDLEGTGVEGITVVNATVYPKEFALLRKISDQYHYFVKVYSRGKAANSDHYMFTEKGVPAIYFYTMGGIKAYHDIYDRAATLPLDHIEPEFNMLLKFNAGLMGLNY